MAVQQGGGSEMPWQSWGVLGGALQLRH